MKKMRYGEAVSGKAGIDGDTVRSALEEMAEPKYREFASSLIPNVPRERILGVRLPKLRRLAADIAKGGWQAYLARAKDGSFEEVMLQGMVIGNARGNLPVIFEYIRQFLPKIDNWSTCDSFCSGLKLAKVYPEEMWEFIQPYFASDEEYQIRFAVVMLLNYYVEETYLERALQLLAGVRHESYYVKMAVAWAVSIFYIRFPEAVMVFLREAVLDDFTYNKTLQKIIESRQVPEDVKKVVRGMKRRN